MSIIISSFPRSGSNFLREYLTQCTDIVTRLKIHDPIDSNFLHEGPIVSIARNPLDSIISIVAMENVFFEGDIDEYITQRIDDYIYFYSNIKNADVVVSYDELVSDTRSVANKLCSVFGGTLNDNQYETLLEDKPAPRYTNSYVVTSSKLYNYKVVAQKIKDYDLSECNAIYTKVLDGIL
jgi:hypothetical protein